MQLLHAIRQILVGVRIEEKTVHPPRERFRPLVHVVEGGNFGEFAIILDSKVVQVCLVFNFGIVNPDSADSDWESTSDYNEYKGK